MKPNPVPWRAVAGRKRRAAQRHIEQAERLEREADEAEARADAEVAS